VLLPDQNSPRRSSWPCRSRSRREGALELRCAALPPARRSPSHNSLEADSPSQTNGERSTAAEGRGGSRAAPAGTRTESPPFSTASRSRTPAATSSSATGLIWVGNRRLEHLAREHALWEVVEPLEAADTAGDHDLAGVPERLQHHLRGLPVPHAAGAAAASIEVARGERSSLADLGPHPFRQLRIAAEGLASPGVENVLRCDPDAVERPIHHRDEAGQVRPERRTRGHRRGAGRPSRAGTRRRAIQARRDGFAPSP